MIILGIDPGTAITGFGVVEGNRTKNRMLDGGVIRTPAKQSLELRLLSIYEGLTQIIKEYSPQVMAVELLYFASNVTTAMAVSQARGVVMLTGAQAKLEIVEYTPLQIKQALTGYGRAEKSQVQEMVKKMLKLEEIPKPDDAADALAVAICHSATLTA